MTIFAVECQIGDADEEQVVAASIAVPEAELDHLRRRLTETRWPDRETVDDWSQGAPLERVSALCNHRRHSHDRCRCEGVLNGLIFHAKTPIAFARTLPILHQYLGAVSA